MRPVNLIPPEERRGISSGSRKNLGAYAIIGTLVLILVAVSAITIFNKKASDQQVELESLQSQVDAAKAEAASFSSFTSFQQIHDARLATIDSLAKSRFDWERVMREVAIVIPDHVYLTTLTGTVSPDASVTNGAGVALRSTIPGPALELTGCAKNQRSVARMIAAMHDIDGVGRVLVPTSAKATPATETQGSSGAPAAGTATAGCSARPTFPTFQLVAALDDVPTATDAAIDPLTGVPASTTTDPAAAGTITPPTTEATTPPAIPTPTTTTPTTATPETATPSTEGGVASANNSNQDEQTAIAAAQQSANNAAQIPSGGGK